MFRLSILLFHVYRVIYSWLNLILSRMRCAILALLLASGMAATGEISVDVTAEYEEFLATTGLQDVEDTETNPLDR